MHPRLAELIDYAEAQRAVLLQAVAGVPEPLWDRRPDAEAWSVAEVLEHLHLVESAIAWLVSWHVDEARKRGLGPDPETTSVLGSLDAFRIPERVQRVSTPGLVRPRGAMTAARGLEALADSRRTFLAAAASGDGLALGTITYAHALLGPLNLYQWMLFVGQHEARHALQISEIGRQLAPTGR